LIFVDKNEGFTNTWYQDVSCFESDFPCYSDKHLYQKWSSYCAVLQAMGLLKENNLKEVMKVADVAGKEFAIEQALDKMRAEWDNLKLTVVPYRETGTFVVKVRHWPCFA
jgi:hypothetical protein